ncbi:hypothetical protein CDCA_CDCA09G2629 [Cyanidium caldarium]|uniref:60S ribosome subunit biogenesis protein NIP7 homolog n=1 Tax=Cyanidium caldarium TaxID=2771 RepID=A0AAV9IWD9_CYACA|nr:hypothetical protein CDCA_CDCA09G2629 [Cyanidium caldarium]
MRPLTEDETRLVLEKLAHFMGKNIKLLIERTDEEHCFRLHNDRVYYMPVRLMLAALTVSRDRLASAGVCVGKFTHSKKFRVQVTFLDYLANYAQCKVWVKGSSEMSFLYGNHVLKTGLSRITEGTGKNQAVMVLNERDVPLGFGVTARSALDCAVALPHDIVVLNQADIGSYLRDEAHHPAAAL